MVLWVFTPLEHQENGYTQWMLLRTSLLHSPILVSKSNSGELFVLSCNLSTSWKTVLRTIMLIVHWTWSRLKDDKLKEIYEVEKQGSGSVSCFKRPSSPSQLSWIWQQLWSLFPCTYNLIPEGLFVCLFLAVRIFLYTAVCFPLHLTI